MMGNWLDASESCLAALRSQMARITRLYGASAHRLCVDPTVDGPEVLFGILAGDD